MNKQHRRLVTIASGLLTAGVLILVPQADLVARDGTPQGPATVDTAASRPPGSPPAVSGVYAGGPRQVRRFERWRGRPVGLVSTYLPAASWSGIEVPTGWARWWGATRYAGQMMVTIAMLPADARSTLRAGARGRYDRHFIRAARRLVANGMGDAVIRIGPEFNQKWARWSAESDPAAYAAYFRRIVRSMRSVPGQGFRFTWCPSAGYAGWDATRAYPGDRFVDVISVDSYDSWWNHGTATPRERWAHTSRTDHEGGLDFWAGFATVHGKPLGIGEWGLVNRHARMSAGGGGGDDPLYVREMHRWIATHDVVFETYFDKNAPDGAHLLNGRRFVEAAQVYRRLWH